MIDVYEVISKNKLAYRHKLESDSIEVTTIANKIENGLLDFSSNTYRRYDGRLVTQFDDLSAENIVLLHLKYQLRSTFKVRFANRNKIIDELFDKLRIARSLQDVTIIRFDLKNYFYSVSTQYIFERYIQNSRLARSDKDYIEDICRSNRYCVAGLPVFNYFIELISKDFDDALRSTLADYGLVFYSRYVDDGIVMLNKYVSKKQVRRIINEAISSVYESHDKNNMNKVRLNEEKFAVINRRHIERDCSFDFLGYEFFIRNKFSDFKVGITKRKRDKYQQKLNKLVKDNYKPGDVASEELMRHIIKAHSSRVVYFAPSAKHRGVWVSKGVIANYNRLKDYSDHIDRQTTNFLNNIYKNAFRGAGFSVPYYLNNPRYSLHSCLVENRAMLFNELIGMPRPVLLKQLGKIGLTPSSDKDYNYLVKDYLIAIKSGY